MTLIEQALAKIAEMEKRVEKATPGPWVSLADVSDVWACAAEDYAFDPQGAISDAEARLNRELAASARSYVPAADALLKLLVQRIPEEWIKMPPELEAALEAFVEAK